MSEIKTLPLTNLLLDVVNPRFESEQDNQREAIRTMAEDQGEKLLNLAQDIVENGLDPSSLTIVMPSETGANRHVVLEGNRRVVALKILAQPDLLSGAWTGSRFQRLKDLSASFKSKQVKEVTAVVVADRDAANHWIVLRHRGEQGGRGIVSWDGMASARYEQRRGGGRSAGALKVVDFVRERGQLDQDTLDRLPDIPLTTLQRLLNDPAAREKLGIDLKDGLIETDLPDEEVLKGLTKVVRDAAHGTMKVSTIETKKHRADYLRSFKRTELPSPRAQRTTPREVGATGAATPAPAARPSTQRPPRKRTTLVPPACVLNITQPKPRDIYWELRRLKPIDDFRNAVGVLFRVFLELSVDHYVITKKIATKAQLANQRDWPLSKKVVKVADDLQTKGVMTKSELLGARRAAAKDHFLAASIETLHAYVHDADFAPAPSDLKAGWDSLERFFKALWP
jgi:hypothetical protein